MATHLLANRIQYAIAPEGRVLRIASTHFDGPVIHVCKSSWLLYEMKMFGTKLTCRTTAFTSGKMILEAQSCYYSFCVSRRLNYAVLLRSLYYLTIKPDRASELTYS